MSCFLSNPFAQPSDYSPHRTSSAVFFVFFFRRLLPYLHSLTFLSFRAFSLPLPSLSLSKSLYMCACSQVCASESVVHAPVHDMRRRMHEAVMGCVVPALSASVLLDLTAVRRGRFSGCPLYFLSLFSDCCCIHSLPHPSVGRFLCLLCCFVSHFESHRTRRTLAYFCAAHALPSDLLEVCPLLFTSYLRSVLCVLPVLLLPAFFSPVRFFRSLSLESALLWAARLVERSRAHAASGS